MRRPLYWICLAFTLIPGGAATIFASDAAPSMTPFALSFPSDFDRGDLEGLLHPEHPRLFATEEQWRQIQVSHNYADGSAPVSAMPALHWFAAQAKSPALDARERKRLREAIHRSSWDDDALFLGFKGGSPSVNHGHMPSTRCCWLFDPVVLGGSYSGHGPADPEVKVTVAPGMDGHPVLAGVNPWVRPDRLYYNRNNDSPGGDPADWNRPDRLGTDGVDS